jgi:hypothetical protein
VNTSSQNGTIFRLLQAVGCSSTPLSAHRLQIFLNYRNSINGHGRELLAALTPAQRSSQAARDLRVLLEQSADMKELPA